MKPASYAPIYAAALYPDLAEIAGLGNERAWIYQRDCQQCRDATTQEAAKERLERLGL